MTGRDILLIMAIIVPIILAVVIFGFVAFIKWSKKESEIQEAKEARARSRE